MVHYKCGINAWGLVTIWCSHVQLFSDDLCRMFSYSSSRFLPPTYRPRLLLAGDQGQGQSSHLGPALLHQMENLAVNVVDLPALLAVGTRTPEESCAQVGCMCLC